LSDALGQGLALFARQQPADLVLAGEDLVAEALQHIVTQLDGGTRPGGKGGLRRRDRALHIAGGRLRKFADDVIGIGGIDVRLLPGRFAPGAGDEVLGLDHGWHLLLLIDLWSSARRRNRSWSFLRWRGRRPRSTGPSTPLPCRNPRTPSSPPLQRRSHLPDGPER